MVLEPLYRPVLREAFKLTVRHKYLWFLGFLAAFLGMGGEYEFLANQFSNVSSGEWNGINNLFQFVGGGQDILNMLGSISRDMSIRALAALIFFLGFLFVFVWIVVVAQGSLVSGIASAAGRGKIRLKTALSVGCKSFWSLLAILVSTRLLAFFVLAVIGLPLVSIIFALDESLVSPGAALIFFVLGVPLFILFSLVAKFGVAYRVIEGERWRVSLQKALVLFAGHWLVTVELALVIFVINILTALLFILAALLLSAPFILLGIVAAELSYVIVLKIFLTAALVLFLLILLILGSALATFQNVAWTLLFLKIKDNPHAPKLLRIIRGWQERYGNR